MYHMLLEKRKTNVICDIACLRILKNDVLDLIIVFLDASFGLILHLYCSPRTIRLLPFLD